MQFFKLVMTVLVDCMHLLCCIVSLTQLIGICAAGITDNMINRFCNINYVEVFLCSCGIFLILKFFIL